MPDSLNQRGAHISSSSLGFTSAYRALYTRERVKCNERNIYIYIYMYTMGRDFCVYLVNSRCFRSSAAPADVYRGCWVCVYSRLYRYIYTVVGSRSRGREK